MTRSVGFLGIHLAADQETTIRSSSVKIDSKLLGGDRLKFTLSCVDGYRVGVGVGVGVLVGVLVAVGVLVGVKVGVEVGLIQRSQATFDFTS